MPVIQNLLLLTCGFHSSVSFTGTTEEDACGSILVVFKFENNLVGSSEKQQVQVGAIRVTSQFHSVFIFGGKGLAKKRYVWHGSPKGWEGYGKR